MFISLQFSFYTALEGGRQFQCTYLYTESRALKTKSKTFLFKDLQGLLPHSTANHNKSYRTTSVWHTYMVAGTEIRLANKQENSIEFATGGCCGVDPHFTYSRGLFPYPPQYIDGRRHPRSPPGQARPVDVSLVVLSLIRKPVSVGWLQHICWELAGVHMDRQPLGIH